MHHMTLKNTLIRSVWSRRGVLQLKAFLNVLNKRHMLKCQPWKRANWALFTHRPAFYRPVMQECEGCWVSTWYTALRPGGGGSPVSTLAAITALSSGRQASRGKRILREIRWKHDHQGNINAFFGHRSDDRVFFFFCFFFRVILQRGRNRGEAGSC